MIHIVIQLLLFLVALALIVLASMWYTRFLIDYMVGSKHRDLDAITSTGAIPEAWSVKYHRKMIRLQAVGSAEKITRVRRAARRSYLRKLARLTEYVRRTRFMESEEVRKHALRSLQRLDREWRSEADGTVS